MKSWVVKKKLKRKQNGKIPRKSRQKSKNSKSSMKTKSLAEKPISTQKNSQSLPETQKIVPVNPKLPPKCLELIDPAVIFTPERKKENSSTLVSIFKFSF